LNCYNQLMTKSKIFLILSLSFTAGVFARSFFDIGLTLIYFSLVLIIIFFVLGYKNKIAWVAILAVLFFIVGIWRTEIDLKKLEDLNLGEKNISAEVAVIKEPEQKEKYQKLIVEFTPSVLRTSPPQRGGEEKVEISSPPEADSPLLTKGEDLRLLINADPYLEINYGDKLKIDCSLEIPENFSDDFDYRMYLAKDKIYYLCRNAQIEKMESGEAGKPGTFLSKKVPGKLYGAILKTKNKMEEKINQVIPQPQAALADGLLFGGSSRLSKEVNDNFSKTGMTHIVAVSGYNVSIIAEYLILAGIFLGFWRKQAFWFALAGIIIFVVMIGLPASAARAGVMGTLLIWAMKNGRLANSQNAIIFAGAVMLIINPLILRWDIGFQLSFMATLGIIMLAPFWEKYFIKKHKVLGLAEILFLTVSAQIFVLPIILHNFHNLSFVSIPANLLILTIVPITMLLVFLTAVSGFIFYPLSLAFAWLAYLPLKYEIEIVNALANLSWANKEVENFGWRQAVVWYLVLFLIIFFLKEKRRLKEK